MLSNLSHRLAAPMISHTTLAESGVRYWLHILGLRPLGPTSLLDTAPACSVPTLKTNFAGTEKWGENSDHLHSLPASWHVDDKRCWLQKQLHLLRLLGPKPPGLDAVGQGVALVEASCSPSCTALGIGFKSNLTLSARPLQHSCSTISRDAVQTKSK